MKAEHINPFYKATEDVFKFMLDLETNKGQLGIVEEMVPGREANVMIGVTGDLSGSVMYCFPKEMILQMVKIMSGMEMEKLDSFVTSALGEMANIITSSAVTNLSQINYICDISPPQIIISNDKCMTLATEKALQIPMETSIGQFEITISLKEK